MALLVVDWGSLWFASIALCILQLCYDHLGLGSVDTIEILCFDSQLPQILHQYNDELNAGGIAIKSRQKGEKKFRRRKEWRKVSTNLSVIEHIT